MSVAQPKIILQLDGPTGTSMPSTGTLANSDYTVQTGGGAENTDYRWVTNADPALSYFEQMSESFYVYATISGSVTNPGTTIVPVCGAQKFRLASLNGGTRKLVATPGENILVYCSANGGGFDININVVETTFSTAAVVALTGLSFNTDYVYSWCYDPGTISAAFIRARLGTNSVVDGSPVVHTGGTLENAWPSLMTTGGGYSMYRQYYNVFDRTSGTTWSAQDLLDINTSPTAITGWPSGGSAPSNKFGLLGVG